MKNARLLEEKSSFHPFQSGLVVRVSKEGGVVACTTGGLLAIGSVVNEKGQDITYRLKNGERFFTPQKELENALPNCDIIFWETEYDCSGPSYGAIM